MSDDVEPKKVGRLLKKGSVLAGKVRITDFKLDEIRESPVIFSDNTEGNVIHSELHEEEEIEAAVKDYPGFEDELIDPALQSTIQFPRNFTKDWLKDKSKAKRKRHSIFEDDEDEDDADYAISSENTSSEPLQTVEGNTVDLPDSSNNLQVEPEDLQTQPDLEDLSNPESLVQMQQQPTVDDSFQMVGDAIKEMGAAEPEFSGTQQFEPEDKFVQTETSQVAEGAGLEDSAIAEYHKQKEVEEIDVEGIKEEAKARGYEEGFRIGEERATIQYHQKSEELFLKVKELLDEFSNLKSDILDNVQGNFFELSQAMCESLVNRSIDLDAEIFAKIMRRAISEAVDGDSFKIVVSSKMNELLSSLDIADLKKSIVSDESMDDRDFRIESKLGVVDSGIRKIISDLLEDANIQLFDTESNKAS